MTNTELVLVLMDVKGIGGRTIEAVLRRNTLAHRTPNEFLAMSESDMAEEYGLRREHAERLASISGPIVRQAEADSVWMSRNGVSLTTTLDALYPARLSDRMDNPPPVLFFYGNGHLLNGPVMAVANSNGAAEQALMAGDRMVEEAVRLGWSVVTGHNRVQYQRAALAARRNGGRVCYVLDRGLIEGFGGDLSRELFPAARIWGPSYDPLTDLSISQFGLRDHGIAANNRMRDSVVFALADVIFAGEVRPGGHMEGQCLAALKGGRPVYQIGPAGSNALELAGALSLNITDKNAMSAALNCRGE